MHKSATYLFRLLLRSSHLLWIRTSAIIAADSPAESKSLQAFGALQRVAAGQGAACIRSVLGLRPVV